MRADVRQDEQGRNVTMESRISTGARSLAALFCLAVASSGCAAFASEGAKSLPAPFGALENRDLAFCRSTGMQDENHCVCSAASIEVPMTFKQFADYLRLGIPEPSTGRAVEVKLEKWAQYCGLDR
jgi:hypothetical protein